MVIFSTKVFITISFSPFFTYLSTLCISTVVFNRLIVTDNAQCGAWNTWCAANKKPRNAKISHAEHPARSDAVKFFFYTLDSDPFKHFEFKNTLYRHFQNLLSTPEKALLLTDANFASKVSPMRRYPACDIDTAHLFDS